jgi:membrane fusion protein (multidrug efflux system)
MTLPFRLRPSASPSLLLLALAAAGLSACDKPQGQAQQARPPANVEVVVLHAQPVSLTTELPGRLSPFRVAEVRPQVNGVILKRLFTEGDAVKEGQQLYQIDPAPYEASLASAKAGLLKAQASTAVAQATVDRYRPLAVANAVSHQDLDNAVATLKQSQADIASADAAVQTAQINLAYTKVLSPISGRTGRSSVTEGALVTANQATSLATVTQLDPIYVDVTQPSSAILRFRRELTSGQIKSAGDNQAAVKLALEDGSSYDQDGKLQFSEVTVDQGTGSVTLRALFPNPQSVLLPGMFVEATLEEGVRQNGILAPQQGVTHDQRGDPTALVVDKDSKVELRSLVTERAVGENWLITKGLADGDKLIVKGLQMAKPGAPVNAKEVALAADGSTRPINSTAENTAGDQPKAR